MIPELNILYEIFFFATKPRKLKSMQNVFFPGAVSCFREKFISY